MRGADFLRAAITATCFTVNFIMFLLKQDGLAA